MFIVDKVPRGIADELEPALRWTYAPGAAIRDTFDQSRQARARASWARSRASSASPQ
jgi:predicted glycosyltransferase